MTMTKIASWNTEKISFFSFLVIIVLLVSFYLLIYSSPSKTQPLYSYDLDIHGECIVTSPDSQYVAIGNDDGMINRYDKSGSLLGTIDAHGESITHLSFSPDGKILVSSAFDHTLKFWNTSNWNLEREFSDSDPIETFAFSPDGKFIALTNIKSSFNTLKLLNISSNSTIWEKNPELYSNYLKFSPDSSIIAFGYKKLDNEMTSIYFWNASNGSEAFKLATNTGGLYTGSFSPDGLYFAAGGSSSKVYLWNLATKEIIKTINTIGTIKDILYSDDGETLFILTSNYEKAILIWNTNSNTVEKKIFLQDNTIRSDVYQSYNMVIFNDNLLVTINSSGIMDFWQVEKELQQIQSPKLIISEKDRSILGGT
jgi:WD40 repeat protein